MYRLHGLQHNAVIPLVQPVGTRTFRHRFRQGMIGAIEFMISCVKTRISFARLLSPPPPPPHCTDGSEKQIALHSWHASGWLRAVCRRDRKRQIHISIVDVGNQMLHLLKHFPLILIKGKAVPSKIIKHMTAVKYNSFKSRKAIKRDSPTSNPIFRKGDIVS